MGKNKLKKFDEMHSFGCVFQYPWGELRKGGFPLRGKWHSEYFGNDRPIVLELGCGKGEYTTGLAKSDPSRNYIGIDIKGARMWTGAKEATRLGLSNVAFIRSDIELIDSFFLPGEVAEIWITFPDPQMQKRRKRLTSTRFLELYRKIMPDGGRISLKTDSPLLYTYTRRLVGLNGLTVLTDTDDLYGSGTADPVSSIKTFYEQQWLSRGKSIKLISFLLSSSTPLVEPAEDDIERDDYHSFQRGVAQRMPSELAERDNDNRITDKNEIS